MFSGSGVPLDTSLIRCRSRIRCPLWPSGEIQCLAAVGVDDLEQQKFLKCLLSGQWRFEFHSNRFESEHWIALKAESNPFFIKNWFCTALVQEMEDERWRGSAKKKSVSSSSSAEDRGNWNGTIVDADSRVWRVREVRVREESEVVRKGTFFKLYKVFHISHK